MGAAAIPGDKITPTLISMGSIHNDRIPESTPVGCIISACHPYRVVSHVNVYGREDGGAYPPQGVSIHHPTLHPPHLGDTMTDRHL